MPVRLTPRQLECLLHIADGESTKSMSRLMRLSPRTVECYRRQLGDRLHIRGIAGLTRWAIRAGLIQA